MAAKIVDGLFIGDALSSMDINFIIANKITRIINCACLELENRWTNLGITYVSFPWETSNDFDLLQTGRLYIVNPDATTKQQGLESRQDETLKQEQQCGIENEQMTVDDGCDDIDKNVCPCVWLDEICTFIQDALDNGEGVLVHSQDGRNRACSCILAYMMYMYGWDLEKAVSYVQSKRLDLIPQQSFYDQLKVISDWLERVYNQRISTSISSHAQLVEAKFKTWNILVQDLQAVSLRAEEEVLLHNTFLNSDSSLLQSPTKKAGVTYANVLVRNTTTSVTETSSSKKKQEKKTVRWIDSQQMISGGHPIMVSPFSKRYVPERPPGPSYAALHATGGWVESDEVSDAELEEIHSKEARCHSPIGSSLIKGRHQNQPRQITSDMLKEQKLDWNDLRERLLSNGMAAETYIKPTFLSSSSTAAAGGGKTSSTKPRSTTKKKTASSTTTKPSLSSSSTTTTTNNENRKVTKLPTTQPQLNVKKKVGTKKVTKRKSTQKPLLQTNR